MEETIRSGLAGVSMCCPIVPSHTPFLFWNIRRRNDYLSQNTTKWVKKALRAKGGAGQDDRKAISEQLRLGQELRAKVKFSLLVCGI